MIEPAILLAFVPAALALNMTPGADMMFCLGRGLRAGPAAGVAASGGVALGVLVHGMLAGLGLGALVAASPWLFGAIRWAGVAYLLVLAVQSLRARPAPVVAAEAETGAGRALRGDTGRALRDGLAVNLANPKVILFILAFVPQFVDPARPVLPQFAALAAILALGGFAVNAGVGVFAGGAGRRLARSAAASRAVGWITAGIFAALAARLAMMERP